MRNSTSLLLKGEMNKCHSGDYTIKNNINNLKLCSTVLCVYEK